MNYQVGKMNDYKVGDPTFESLAEALKEAVDWSDRDITIGVWDVGGKHPTYNLLYIIDNKQLFVPATEKLKELMDSE